MISNIRRYAVLALSIVGSATLLLSCGKKPQSVSYDNETLMTESSEHRTITMMENGKRSYTFTSPLMEGYRLAANPYQEFRRGIEMTTYTDSLSLPEVTITANYAIYYERQKLWEAKGNVVVIRRDRKDGDTTVTGLTEVYTQQLFWNATTKKIYSNVDTKVLQADGWHFGVGFDADDDLKNIHFRKYSSEIEFDMSQMEESDNGDKKEDKPAEKSDSKKSTPQKDRVVKDNNRDSGKDSGKAKSIDNPKSKVTEPMRQPMQPVGNQMLRPTESLSVSPMQHEGGKTKSISTLPEQGVRKNNEAIRSVGIKNREDSNPHKLEE
ncbi:MAG: LPS export ABC transporter periplasmic protein LptC [Alistipes sp.]|nr:LPS export ABC transporter periplasmic protein LptC [Alistipes sp.]